MLKVSEAAFVDLLDRRVKDILDAAAGAVRRRRERELEVAQEYETGRKNLREKAVQSVRHVQEEERQRLRELGERVNELKASLEEAEERYAEAFRALKQDLRRRHREHRHALQEAMRAYQEGVWESSTLHDALKAGVEADLATYGACLDELRDFAKQARKSAIELAAGWGTSSIDVSPFVTEPAATAAELRNLLQAEAARAQELLEQARKHPRVGGPGIAAIVIAVVLTLTASAIWGWQSGNPVLAGLLGLAGAAVAAMVAGLGAYLWNRRRVRTLLGEVLRRADWIAVTCDACKNMLATEAALRIRSDQERHRAEVRRLKERLRADVAEIRERLARSRAEILNVRLVELRSMQQAIERMRQELAQTEQETRAAIRTWRRAELIAIKETYRQESADLVRRREQAERQAEEQFLSELALVKARAEDLWSQVRAEFPEWHEIDASGWRPCERPLGYFLVGTLTFRTADLPGLDRRWHVPEEYQAFRLPALLRGPLERAVLVSRSDGPEVVDGVLDWFCAVATRYLMSLPPADARLLILDLANMGANFGGFMHLSDFDKRLISGRIWTTRSDAEEMLRHLFEDMESILQTCLRNEYADLEAYNATAGELAEPYRLVIVTDFPDGLSETTLEQVRTIAENARRCGVSLFLLSSSEQNGRRLLNTPCARLTIQKDLTARCPWQDIPLVFETEKPPPSHVLTGVVRIIGQQALERGKVEVPFEQILPPRDKWWTESTQHELRIPLGLRPGHAVQELRLGVGTSQHVLVAGRTGSGKSNLLHVLVLAGCLKYSPDELQLYLVDFKKGVEFKPYATWELPHARVIAIESEREFGLSVLQQLDREMRHRGELFRAAGVQDIAEYRNKCPETKVPRILLIIDEFQEFFVEEDDVARGASMLLDRLVRQGRAFGIHVLLGSQTLGGAYTLARSTISQMGVRIALQCSESDAHLILSEDNPAARLLTRPGEAIYNDANGLKEGNQRFQIAWLPPAKREFYLERIQETARARGVVRTSELVVFEGNVPAELLRNRQLRHLLEQRLWVPPRDYIELWPGESVAFPEPVAIRLGRETGANVLFVGQDPELVGAMFVSLLISAAAQVPPPLSPGLPTFCVVDAASEDRSLRKKWDLLARLLPHGLLVGTRSSFTAVLDPLASELEHRLTGSATDRPPVLLFVYDLAQLRALQYSDDLFEFRSFDAADKKEPPSQLWQKLLKEGPQVGMHTIVWCDSPSTVWRMLTRTLLREFSWRVGLQMNVNDSTSLLDTPAAAKLGPNRALLYAEQTGTYAKFRPYGPLTDEQLAELAAALQHFRVETVGRSAET